MNTSIYDKTEKGREEIATRKNQLPARLRTLLLMVDGQKPAETLLQNTAALGVDEDSLKQLEADGFIVRTGPEEVEAQPDVARRSPVLRRTAAGLRRIAP
ncbi:MAG TPA: hypothetical protein VGE60_10910 [Telluria sp.]